MAARTDPHLDTIVGGRYRLRQKLGEGGMGIVYLAEHVLIEKRVALKMLSPRVLETKRAVSDFLKEAKTTALIKHDHVVDITDFGETDDGEVFLVMELLEGKSLAEHIVAGVPMPLPRVRRILEQVFDALCAAHQRGVIHRDLKPENIFLVEQDKKSDFVKILDFGLATIRDLGGRGSWSGKRSIVGTPEYMSPEQARGEQPHPRFDIYAMGCILYELLTGRPPFIGASPIEILTSHQLDAPVAPTARVAQGLTVELDAVVMRALAKDPAKRYQRMEELQQATLEALAAAGVGEAPPPMAALAPGAPVYGLTKADRTRTRPRRRLLGGLVAALLALGGGVGAAWYVRGGPEREARRDAAAIQRLIARGALVDPPGENALAALEDARSRNPGQPALAPLSPALSAALATRGREELAAGRYRAAASLLERAAALAPEEHGLPAEAAQVRRAESAAAAGMVPVDDFWIDRYEYPNRAGAIPKTHVDYDDAAALCARGEKRLCTESEWQRACAGSEGRSFPYAASYERGACATEIAGDGPRPAGATGRCVSVEGVADLSGNVAEWTSSAWKHGAPQRVVRGGHWSEDAAHVGCASRDYFLPGLGGARHIGFRCCR